MRKALESVVEKVEDWFCQQAIVKEYMNGIDISMEGVHYDKIADYLERIYPDSLCILRKDGCVYINNMSKPLRLDIRSR